MLRAGFFNILLMNTRLLNGPGPRDLSSFHQQMNMIGQKDIGKSPEPISLAVAFEALEVGRIIGGLVKRTARRLPRAIT